MLLALHIDAKHRLRGFVEVSRGGISSALCQPMQVFRAAVILGCASIVLTHNHPSGDPTPSHEDIELTKRIVQGAQLLGTNILDHVIVTDDGHYSLLDSGLILLPTAAPARNHDRAALKQLLSLAKIALWPVSSASSDSSSATVPRWTRQATRSR